MIHMPIEPDLLHDELVAVKKVLEKWIDRMGNVPAIDSPSSEEEQVRWLTGLCGELLYVAAKLEAMATTIGGTAPGV